MFLLEVLQTIDYSTDVFWKIFRNSWKLFFFQVTAEWLSRRPLQIYVHLSVILPTKLNESDDLGIKFDDE